MIKWYPVSYYSSILQVSHSSALLSAQDLHRCGENDERLRLPPPPPRHGLHRHLPASLVGRAGRAPAHRHASSWAQPVQVGFTCESARCTAQGENVPLVAIAHPSRQARRRRESDGAVSGGDYLLRYVRRGDGKGGSEAATTTNRCNDHCN